MRQSRGANASNKKGATMATPKTTPKANALGLSFGTEPPSATRESRYQPLYDTLTANPGQWADVTDAIAELVKTSGGAKVPTAQASAITLKNRGFEATSRKTEKGDRVYARFVPEAK